MYDCFGPIYVYPMFYCRALDWWTTSVFWIMMDVDWWPSANMLESVA